jgi:hypothetical protein
VEIVDSVLNNRILAELVLLFSMPVVITYATYKATLALALKGRPWDVGVPGIGGALVLLGQALHTLESFRRLNDWDFALIAFGLSLMLFPRVYKAATSHHKGVIVG